MISTITPFLRVSEFSDRAQNPSDLNNLGGLWQIPVLLRSLLLH